MLTAILATTVAIGTLYIGIKLLNVNYLINKHASQGKCFIISFPKWWTLLGSVKLFDEKDYVSKEHVDYKVMQGMEKGEADLEEWIIVLEMELLKHAYSFVTTYCIVEDGKVVAIKPLDEYYHYLVGYLKGYRIYKQISEEINDED